MGSIREHSSDNQLGFPQGPECRVTLDRGVIWEKVQQSQWEELT